MTGFTVSGVAGGEGLRRKPLGTAKRLQTTVAVLAVVMLFASLLAVAQRSDFLESVAEAPTRDLVNPADTLTSAEAALLEQLARVGDGITLEGADGATTSLDGRFMLAGPAFETESGSSFAVVTSSWMGADITRAAEPVLEGDRVVYAHDGLTEWWVRNARGYEQGWTVDAPPADGSTDLTLDVVFEGAATTQLSPTTIELILGDGSRAWYRNLHAFDAEGTPLPAYLTTQGSQVTVTVEADGAVYPVTIDPILTQDQSLIPPDSSTGDVFGEAVATDGDLMIVSVRGADQNVADRGRAEIYKWDGSDWNYQDTLVNPVVESTDFGWDVDINVTAGFAVVGSPGDDTNGVDSGAAYVFVDNNDGTWSLKDTLYECNVSLGANCGTTADGTFDGNQFGRSVSMSDNARVAVGAPAVAGAQGVVYVYEELPAAGSSFQTSEDRTLKGSTSGDRFGEAAAIAAGGDYLVVGAPGTTVAGNADAGEVTLASFAGGVWTIDDTDIGPNNSAGKEYGASVAIADITGGIADYLVVAGLPHRTRFDDAGTGFTGVRVMSFTTAGLSLSTVGLGDVSSPTSDTAMGFSVATDGVNVIVGEPFNSGLNAPERGLVRVFTYIPASNTMDNGGAGGASAAQQNLPVDWAPPIADGIDRYGYSVAVGPQTGVSGPYVTGIPNWVSTTPRRSPQTGRVATASAAVSFAPNVGETTLLTQSPDKTAAALDRLGFAVAISGNRMAASAIGDDESQSQNGIVYTYERADENASWTLDQLIVDPTPTDDAKPFGFSLDMEGNFLAIGSPGGDGQVDVFELVGGVWTARPSLVGNPAENSADDLDFGHDVAISTDGDVLAVSIFGYDYPAVSPFAQGAVRVYDWDGGNYVERTLIEDGQFQFGTGISIDMDEIPGSSDMRLVLGSTDDSMNIYTVEDGVGGNVFFDENFDGPSDGSESVAIDNDRIAVVSYSGANDEVRVIDLQADGDWVSRLLFDGVLFATAPSTSPNNLVDVSGDSIIVGMEDEIDGGEVAVFFNDPAYGWGQPDTLTAWTDGAIDQIVPSVQQASHRIGRAVAIDGAGATKSIVFGADGRDTNGVDAGTVYALRRTEAGNAAPTNKIVPPDFVGGTEAGLLGRAISIGESAWGVGGVVAQDRQVHRVEPAATGWEIVQTFDYFSDVIDVDFDAANGTMVVLLQNGEVWAYAEDACGAAADCSFSARALTPAIDVGTVNQGSLAIAGNDVVVAIASGTGDQFQQLIDFGDGGNAPVGPPAGVLAGDLFGASMDASGTTVAIGAPGADANDGRVYIWDAVGSSFTHTIDSTIGPGTAGRFGNSVALEGDTLVVGAPSFDADGSVDGVVEIVDIAAGAITPIDTLIPSGGSGLSGWGQSVDLDGSTLVIGGSGFEQSGIPYRHGAAVAYGFDGTDWVETDNFTASDFALADQAGFAVGVVGTEVLVGATLDDNTQGEDAGAIYAYTATAIDVGPANRLLADDATSSGFGRHIDIDGSVAVITEHDGGAMQIYDLVGVDWVFRQRIDGFAESVRDVSIDGTRIAVIDRIGNELFLFEESGGTFAAFATRSLGSGVPESVVLDGDDIFVGLLSSVVDLPIEHHLWAGGTVTVPPLAGSADAGWSIAKEGNLVFVGARFWDNTPDDNAGRVHIYDTSVPAWTGVITADQAGSLFGSDLSASNGRLVVGYQGGEGPDPTGPNPTDFTGIAEVYNNLTPTGADLEQIITGSNQDIADSFGKKVAIDGDLIAVGAPATSYDGVRRGQVIMFAFDGTSFVEAETFRSDTDSTGTDQFGHDVAVSGLNVVAGAFQHDNTRGTDAGAAYYFTSAGVPVVDDPNITFNLGLGQGSPTSISVAPAGVSVTDFNGALIEQEAEDDTTLAASSLNDTPISALPISALPISALPISALATEPGSPLNVLPILQVDLDIDGGWPALFADSNSALAGLPINDVTLGDVFGDTDASGALASTPISALDVNGTPISALPISALLLGALELDELSTSIDWCDILVDFVDAANDCTIAADEEAVGNLTLIEASLSGVPISALPISALPISALPISATGVDALPISALPISALDLEASPISAVPISALPISATPISALPISATPISALDPASIPISATSVSGLPISALPISALELGGLPISATPISALPISALELSNIPISATPISATPISALPISAVPISAVFLADSPLSDIPISAVGDGSDWCTLLADLAAGYDCSFEVPGTSFLDETTIVDLGVRGIPISALPISAVPISAVPISATPISALPISALPISAVTLGSLPISATPISATPISAVGTDLASTPISAVDLNGTPISALPISALLVGGTPISATPISATPISALPISATPISATPISAVLLGGTPISATPISAVDLAASPISATPISALPISALGIDCALVDCDVDSLYDAFLAGAIDPATTLGELQASLAGFSMADIAPHFNGFTEQDVIDAIAASGQTLGDLLSFDGIELADLPLSDPNVANLVLGDFLASWSDVRLGDLVGALLDPATGQPFPDADVEAAIQTILADAAAAAGVTEFTLADLDVVGDMTIDDLLSGDLTGFNADSLGSILNLVHLNDNTGQLEDATGLSGETFGTIDPALLGDLTLLDILGLTEIETLTIGELFDAANAADALYGFSVSDLLLALLGLDAIPFAGFDFTEVESGQLPETVLDAVTFEATFELAATAAFNRSVDLAVELPSTASYLTGTVAAEDVDTAATIDIGEPFVDGNILRWTVLGVEPDQEISVTFDVRPTVTIGSTALSGSASLVGTDITAASFTSVDVIEGIEPNDYPATTPLAEDTVYLTYISSETDNDVFSITVGENDEIAVQLSSLTADLDIAIYGEVANTSTATALTDTSDAAPLDPITDPDQAGADTEPLNDFRRLDEEDPSLVFLDVSNAPGTETELLVTDPLPAGTYYIQVFGANGATNVDPAALQIDVIGGEPRPICSANGLVTGALGTAPSLAGSTANTLFLVNEQRMRDAYGQAGLDEVTTALDDLVEYLTNTNPALGIDPVVVPVDGIGPVQAAYQTWDTDSTCDPEAANAVVQAIIENAIDPLRETLDHVVVIGGDPIIPMARLLDSTELANEYDFRHEFIGDNLIGGNADQINALSATFWDRRYLSDEPYGASDARSLGNRFLYVSDIALGRMVETPTEIAAQLDHFVNFNGSLEANTASVLGYDFLVDSSEQIAADLLAAGLTVDDELADGLDAGGAKWDKDDAAAKLVGPGGAADLVSLNGHFDHYRALPADGDQVPGFTNNFEADEVLQEILATPGLLEGSIIFSMGCHGGLSVSDLQIADGADNTNGDWAQTFAADQAIFIGNTGFGYGDTEAVAYTEQLMAKFAELVVRPALVNGLQTTVGEALMFAKNDYVSDLSTFSVYDEKALMESTFYGLPFYRVGATPVPVPPAPDNTTSPDSTGIETLGVNADATNDPNVEDRGQYWSNPDENGDPQTIVAPGRPIQPSLTTDVSVVDAADSTELGQVAHGAVILGMDSQYQPNINPVVAAVVVNESEDSPEPDLGEVVFPAKPVTINSATTPGGERQSLVLATGQFDSDGLVQRLDDNINAVVYYSDPTETDFEPPTIGVVESNFDLAADLLTITLSAVDTDNPVVRVYVLAVADPGAGSVTWTGLDLVKTPGTDEWSGSLSLQGDEVEFLIQAVDMAGNVGFATNKARNFVDDGSEEPEQPAPDLNVVVPNPGPEGWYTGPVTVAVNSGDLDTTYEITPGTPATPTTGGQFTVDGQGIFTWTVTASDGQETSGIIRIDSTPPSVELAPPADGATYEVSQVPSVGFACTDPSLVSCTATVTPAGGAAAPLANGEALPNGIGSYTVSVTAADAFGNIDSASASYTVIADVLDPIDATVSPANLDIDSGLYTGDVEVIVVSETDVEYSLDGGATVTTITAPGGTFTIVDEGVTAWTVTRPADGASAAGSVEIDTTAPVVTITAPVDAEVYAPGQVPALDFECTDANLAVTDPCVATIDGVPIADGDALPDAVGGPYVVEVTGTDVLGLQTVETASYTVTELSVVVSPVNLDIGSGLYTGDVEVTVDGGGFATEYTLNGGTPVAIPAAGGSFTITAEEVTEWVVTRTIDNAEVTGSVEIDTTAPTASLIEPSDGATFTPGTVPAIDFDCTDRNLFTCEATVDGAPVILGASLPDAVGTYDIIVTGTDDVGLETTATGSYTVSVPPGDPIIITDIEIDGVAEPGEPVDIWGSFVGGVAPYTIAVDWGDGGTCADGTCAIEAPTVDEDGMFDAGYVYPVGGAYTVTVTITDAAGSSVVETLTSATCTITGTNGRDVLRGTTGDDVICGFAGNDRLYGRGGNDIIFGGSGRDRLYGQNGDDILFGGRDNDILYGSFGDDDMSGGRGVDTLIAGDGDDILKGRQNTDWMYGQNDNDTLIGNRGNDRMFGGTGDDIMDGRRGNDRMYGQAGNDTMDGGNGDDLMYGGNNNDIMNGQNGDDDIYGGRGNDTIDGGPDSDLCRGNNGTDTLVGCEF